MPFEPQGELSQWRVVYEHLKTLQVDEVLTDDELQGLLPRAPWGSVYGAFRRAVREMEEVEHRTFDRERNVGYRMVHAREHEKIARQYRRRASRSMNTAHRKARSADRSRLNSDERRRIDGLEHHLAMQSDMLRRLAVRHEELHERVAHVDERVGLEEKTSAHVDDRLSALEKALRVRGMLD